MRSRLERFDTTPVNLELSSTQCVGSDFGIAYVTLS